MKLELEPAPDIVKSVAEMAKRPFVVGFAAETDDVEEMPDPSSSARSST